MTTDQVREWSTAVERELGLHGSVDSDQGLDAVQEVTALVAEQVGAAAAARTAYLIGAAAGTAEEPPIAAQDFSEKVTALARSWNADTEQAVPPNDQENRAG